MRYYDFQIFDKNGALYRQYKSLDAYGNYNPGCLMVEFDIQRYGMSTPDRFKPRKGVWRQH